VRVKLARLQELVGRRTQWQEQVTSLKRMREWVFAAEHLLSGAWAETEETLTNAAVAEHFDQWLGHLAQSLQTDPFSEHERQCLEHFVQTTHSFRPHLILCYDVNGLPPTNNETERYIRSLKTRARRMSGRKNWNSYLLRYGRYIAYYDCLAKQEAGDAVIEQRLKRVSLQQWRAARSSSRIPCSEQLKIWRFRHQRDQYLHSLQMRWQATAGGT
jgi:hypothetical protein